MLTQKETTEISLSAQQSPNDKFRLLKTMARLRMNGDDADHIIGILNNLSSYRQFGKGQVSENKSVFPFPLQFC